MAQDTLRPSSTQRDGRVRSSSTVLATAQAGSSLNEVSGSDPMISGDRLNVSTFELFLAWIGIDCSSIAPADAVTKAVVELTFGGSTVSNSSDLELYAGDAGTIVENADWVNPTTAMVTLYGTIAAASISSGATVQCALNAAGIAAVQAAVASAGYFSCVLVAKATRLGTTPTGDTRIGIRSSENATPANRPALIVDHIPRPILEHHYRMMRAA